MTISRVQACAVEEKNVRKPIVLAGSFRRVRTATKLAVFTTFAVSREFREKLKVVFDLVLLLEQEVPNGLSLDDYAKIQRFSLLIFNKCVFLSPKALVLKNCDEIFEKYAVFASSGKDDVNPSVFVYVPSLDYSRALEEISHGFVVGGGAKGRGNFGGKSWLFFLKKN